MIFKSRKSSLCAIMLRYSSIFAAYALSKEFDLTI